MDRRGVVRLLGWLALACVPAPGAAAVELGEDPWIEEGGRGYVRRMDMDDEEGEDTPQRAGEAQKQLFRCPMNGLESAQYSAAELLLQRGDIKGAIAAVENVLAKTESEPLRDVTHFNLAKLNRRIGNLTETAKHYREVKGPLRYAASKRLLDLLTQAGRPDEAEKITDEFLAKAKQKGEKLAGLHRLAQTFQHRKMPDRALAVYQRIAKEFTPEDMKQMLRDIEKEVDTTLDRIRKQEPGNPREEDEKIRKYRQDRTEELQAAGRWDEVTALEKAVERACRRLEQQREQDMKEPKAEPKEPPKEEVAPVDKGF
jgi:tetratricopeptide (TPR) repeat protein